MQGLCLELGEANAAVVVQIYVVEVCGCQGPVLAISTKRLWGGSTTVVYTVVWQNCMVDDHGEIQRCDWLKTTHSLKIHTRHIQQNAFPNQSHRRISPLIMQTTEFRQTTV